MINNALGLIEVVGKLAAVEAADVALKAANVTLLGMENATGALITVKLTGDVGAVKAAVDAARMAVGRVGTVIATQVLPRPAHGIYPLLTAEAPAGGHNEPTVMPAEEPLRQDNAEEALLPVEEPEPAAVPVPEADEPPEEAVEEEQEPVYLSAETEAEADSRATCNICHDPVCPREKGQSVKLCIHGRGK
ncbi:BMC domain-containing protein [Propionispora hippei]|uniref:Carboxysome shell and ethanolamine utilization microcompartment protein CcmL/EutN n=1 Tax=Propionispora hippei DSM 15287 TaxID=1123003 RepID=A0A1M6JG30_9FIRM|nr:BMC domain-containing protein [Propionispora hippei]SHJ45668.1 Carboxysome shell and ethanolamine utilization microcompartment protein CcmL/EutN [Propionispora hippei DSM 15287]